MRLVGFSTGAIALGDFRLALKLLEELEVDAIELSALRLPELSPLLAALDDLDLGRYEYVSFHAPSKFSSDDEAALVKELQYVAERKWPIILHPDSIHDWDTWLPLEQFLCFENMDKRKSVGRTAQEMAEVFTRFPSASFCFDVGHAHQIDRTMTEARLIGKRFGRRMSQVHVSEVNTRSEHVGVSTATEMAFAQVADLVGDSIPLIIESVLPASELRAELDYVTRIFESVYQNPLFTD